VINLIQFLRELKKEKTRIVLTVFAIAWGSASITLLLATGDGVMGSIRRGAEGMGKGIVVVWGGKTTRAYQGLKAGRRIRLREPDAGVLRYRVAGIGLISPEYIKYNVRASYGRQVLNTNVHGVWPEYGPLRNVLPRAGGRFLNRLDLDRKRRVIFIGNEVKSRLFGGEKAVGKTVLINGVPFTVIGVMRDKVQSSSYSWMDRDNTFIPASTFRMMFSYAYINNIVYRPRSIGRAELVKERVYSVLGQRYKFDPDDESSLRVWDTIEQQGSFEKVALGIRLFLGIIGALTLIVAGMGLANITYAMVKNRTREIGIKLAVGAKPRDIIVEYLVKSIITVFAGGFIGLGFSWLLIKLVNLIPLNYEAFKYVGKPVPVMSLSTAIVVTAILAVVGVTAGIFPARRAASINPAEALRYE